MNEIELKQKLYTQIPLTKFMQISIDKIGNKSLKTSAPLEPNINDKGTAFAGSLSTLVTISAWCACFLKVKDLGYENPMIAIIDSSTKYKVAVNNKLNCETMLPNIEEIKTLKDKLKSKKSGSIKIISKIIQDNDICVEFEGLYVIKV